jgi:hypothetical protein
MSTRTKKENYVNTINNVPWYKNNHHDNFGHFVSSYPQKTTVCWQEGCKIKADDAGIRSTQFSSFRLTLPVRTLQKEFTELLISDRLFCQR